MQDGEPYLAATARPVVARVSPVSAAEASLRDGDKVTVESALGSVTVPLDGHREDGRWRGMAPH